MSADVEVPWTRPEPKRPTEEQIATLLQCLAFAGDHVKVTYTERSGKFEIEPAEGAPPEWRFRSLLVCWGDGPYDHSGCRWAVYQDEAGLDALSDETEAIAWTKEWGTICVRAVRAIVSDRCRNLVGPELGCE